MKTTAALAALCYSIVLMFAAPSNQQAPWATHTSQPAPLDLSDANTTTTAEQEPQQNHTPNTFFETLRAQAEFDEISQDLHLACTDDAWSPSSTGRAPAWGAPAEPDFPLEEIYRQAAAAVQPPIFYEQKWPPLPNQHYYAPRRRNRCGRARFNVAQRQLDLAEAHMRLQRERAMWPQMQYRNTGMRNPPVASDAMTEFQRTALAHENEHRAPQNRRTNTRHGMRPVTHRPTTPSSTVEYAGTGAGLSEPRMQAASWRMAVRAPGGQHHGSYPSNRVDSQARGGRQRHIAAYENSRLTHWCPTTRQSGL